VRPRPRRIAARRIFTFWFVMKTRSAPYARAHRSQTRFSLSLVSLCIGGADPWQGTKSEALRCCSEVQGLRVLGTADPTRAAGSIFKIAISRAIHMNFILFI
jgi:hypothetical protein